MASRSQPPLGERLVIGITGRIGSGKTTVGRYLESRYGFQYLRYSGVLADWLANDPQNKAHLQKVGWEVIAGGMQAELNRRVLPGSNLYPSLFPGWNGIGQILLPKSNTGLNTSAHDKNQLFAHLIP